MDYLIHYGIPGMRWGVRKEYEKTGKRSSQKAKKKKSIAKKVAIGAAIVAGTALAAYGGYKIGKVLKNKRFISGVGIKAVKKMGIPNTKPTIKKLPDSFSTPSVKTTNIPRVEVPRTNIQKTSIPRLTLNPTNVSIGEDYTKKILESSTKLSDATKKVADMSGVFGSLDDLTAQLLKKT